MAKTSGKPTGLLAKIKQILGGLGFRLTDDQTAKVESELANDLARAPRIAILGETGVGKSSTLNALFNAGAEIDHIKPCTVTSTEYAVVTEVSGSHGPIRVVDMPGLGQDPDADRSFLREYGKILAECDVALWILDACTRTLSQAHLSLREIVHPSMSGLDRLVIGINKIDRMEPGNWNYRTNTPSAKQKESIAARAEDVKNRLGTPLRLGESRIIPYSARQQYHLSTLLLALMDACPKERRWVLHDRVDLARYEDFVDPVVLEQLKARSGKQTRTRRSHQ